MIQIQKLCKSFGSKIVLQGVDLTISDGATMCIIGKSGCGKSVLLKHIVGLLEADSGQVIFDGKEIGKLSQNEIFDLRTKVGYVFQGSALFDSMNVYENVVIGLFEHGQRDETKLSSEAIRVLSAVGLLPDIDDFNTEFFRNEWNVLKYKKPSDLSGGMRKRVGVARALAGNPKYVFYDEPTTGLDPVTSEQIDDLIFQLAQKFRVTSLVITHDMFSVLKIADSVALLDDVKVRFEGSPIELKSSTDEAVIEFLERYNLT